MNNLQIRESTIRQIVQFFGSNKAVAKAIGVTPSSWFYMKEHPISLETGFKIFVRTNGVIDINNICFEQHGLLREAAKIKVRQFCERISKDISSNYMRYI